jgi:hypothetical protein
MFEVYTQGLADAFAKPRWRPLDIDVEEVFLVDIGCMRNFQLPSAHLHSNRMSTVPGSVRAKVLIPRDMRTPSEPDVGFLSACALNTCSSDISHQAGPWHPWD